MPPENSKILQYAQYLKLPNHNPVRLSQKPVGSILFFGQLMYTMLPYLINSL